MDMKKLGGWAELGVEMGCGSRARSLLPGSAGGPGHLASGKQVDVEMGNRFAAVASVVDDGAEAAAPAELGGQLGNYEHHVSE